MVTGSHIPVDSNGLKFYVPEVEISKTDEQAILEALGRDVPAGPRGTLQSVDVTAPFAQRYLSAFGSQALNDLRISIYEHSSVARDVLISTDGDADRPMLVGRAIARAVHRRGSLARHCAQISRLRFYKT